MDTKIIENKKKTRKILISTILIVIVISFFVLFFIEKEVRKAKFEELEKQEQRVVTLETDFLGREIDMFISDIDYLHYAFENEIISNKEKVSANWIEFSKHKRIYDQIRFIDSEGFEKIRINFDGKNSREVLEKELQNKADRYYFAEALKLKDGEIYISPLDLNIEHGKIEIPHKPMIRISTPIYDDNLNLKGVIVLNYLANKSLLDFRYIAKNSQGEIILLNSDGYSLSSNDYENDWNFMFNDKDKEKESFKNIFPEEWNLINEGEGQYITENGLITFSKVHLSDKYNLENNRLIFSGGDWHVVSILKRNSENAEFFNDRLLNMVMDIFKNNIAYFNFMIIVSVIIGFLVYINRKTYSKIKYYSEYDSLTQTFNRRAGIEKLNLLFPENDRRKYIVSMCFIDINGLKEVNDVLGHKYGDELITTVVNVIKGIIREEDFIIRLGGDEFLIVFGGIDEKSAEKVWQRIVSSYNRINKEEKRQYIISVSHGIVDFENSKKSLVEDIINIADEKMYAEKKIIKSNLNIIKK